jgi:hypothetical protein
MGSLSRHHRRQYRGGREGGRRRVEEPEEQEDEEEDQGLEAVEAIATRRSREPVEMEAFLAGFRGRRV